MFKKGRKYFADFYQGEKRVRKSFPTAAQARAAEVQGKKEQGEKHSANFSPATRKASRHARRAEKPPSGSSR
ncbi:MAG: hypothetical protein ACYC92_03780 [Candidatus Acidiferrales bacterium]